MRGNEQQNDVLKVEPMATERFIAECSNLATAPIPLALSEIVLAKHNQHTLAAALADYVVPLPHRHIEEKGDVYLTRYTIWELGDGCHVYLHHICRPDRALELHDHPWVFAAHVLVGGYIEQRWQNGGRVGIIRQPGTSYHCNDTTYHRIAELLAPDCWTLVITAPKSKSWSFWMPETGVVTPWREFLAAAEQHERGQGTTP